MLKIFYNPRCLLTNSSREQSNIPENDHQATIRISKSKFKHCTFLRYERFTYIGMNCSGNPLIFQEKYEENPTKILIKVVGFPSFRFYYYFY